MSGADSPDDADDRQPLDPAAILRRIDSDRHRAESALTPNAALLYAIWGITWIIGFAALYAAFVPVDRPLLPMIAAGVIAAVVLVAAIVISTIHSARRGAGSRGPSVVQGAIFGNIFPVAFLGVVLLGWRLHSVIPRTEQLMSYWVAAPLLVLGVLFIAGALMWNDRSQLFFGAWTLVIALVSIALPPPHTLIAGIAGGLGFVVLAGIQTRRPALASGPITRSVDHTSVGEDRASVGDE